MIRLDKLLGHSGYGTRREIKSLCRRGDVTVNGIVVKDGAYKVDTAKDCVAVGCEAVAYEEFYYLMLHKPAGVVSAASDSRFETVLGLLPPRYGAARVFPVGRLDKDTTGLLLMTNDGTWAHNVISPKKNVPKAYFAEVDGTVLPDAAARFAAGIVLPDGCRCLPAAMRQTGDRSLRIVVREGKFHQIKRMCKAVGLTVTALHRHSIGALVLDETLAPGEFRELTATERDLPLISE